MKVLKIPAWRDTESVCAHGAECGGDFATNRPHPVGRRPVKLASPALLAMAAAATLGVASTALAYDPPPQDFFPVGVFLQPVENFDLWKSRGVNTVVDFAGGSQLLETWNAAAVSRGLYMIRAPRADATKDVNEKYLLAWSHTDEPDYKGIAPSTLQTDYNHLKKIDPNRPVYVNFAGTQVLNPYDLVNKPQYQQYMQAADWVANDIYPITAWNHPEWIDFSKKLNPADLYNATGQRMNPGIVEDTLRNWSGGKPQFAYIETSWQDLNSPAAANRGVTPAEFRGEVWDAIIHGAHGITYFPQRVGATVFMQDNTPADVAAEMTKQDALIKSLGGVLNSGTDATRGTVSFDNPDLEGTWRDYNGKKYLLVLNMSSQTLTGATFSTAGLSALSGSSLAVFNELRDETVTTGAITDSFGPYQLHVYTNDLSGSGSANTTVGTPVPEPAAGSLGLLGLGAGLLRRRRRRPV